MCYRYLVSLSNYDSMADLHAAVKLMEDIYGAIRYGLSTELTIGFICETKHPIPKRDVEALE